MRSTPDADPPDTEPSSGTSWPMSRVLPRSLPGLLGAALLWIAGLAPSLLPRPPVVAAGLAGLLAALGYGLGCAAWWLARRLGARPSPVARRGLAVVTAVAWVVVVPATVRGAQWQAEQADALGMAGSTASWGVVLVGGAVIGWLLVLAGRAIRAPARGVARRFGSRFGRGWGAVAGAATGLLVVVAVVGAAYAVTLGLFTVLNDRGSGLPAPTSALRSGGPGSLVDFAAMGAEGQAFVDGGPSPADIGAYTGTAAQEPIRVYVGLGDAATPQERAELAVQELTRTHGFDRKVLVVAITTGNGYVDPALVSTPEYLTGGDVATAATQYSVLPSWLSFLVDQKAAGAEAQALWDAVSDAVDAMPASSRPLLATSGESLGAFGGQAPFAGQTPDQVASRAGAAVWVGTPGASAVWPAWRDGRSAGPEWEPVIGDGTIARNPATADSAAWSLPGWGPDRVVLTQHANDPVSWWDPSLVLHRPGWLDDPRGPGTDPRMTWWPGVFFLQTGLDLAAAGAVPAGVGHNYGDVTSQAWAFALSARGSGTDGAWTRADSDRLRTAVSGP